MANKAVLREKEGEGGVKMKPILIVEDEAILRDSLHDWLTDGGYQVETTNEGEKALEAIAKQDFGLLILDLRLPGKNGIEVLREAKARSPQLKGIIITAYPSVQTAVEAMREGAIDYLPKPFDLNELEKLVRETLGPIQIEIKPKKAAEKAPTKPAKEEAKAKKAIAITPEEIPSHLEQGKQHFQASRYQEALEEFQNILAVAPGNIETRVWLRKTNELLTKPKVEGVAGEESAPEEGKLKVCVWAKMGMISQRICNNDYECVTCEFDQMMQEKMASGESTELDATLEKFKALPGNQRLCRYALKGDVSHRLCSRIFQCATCEFGQTMEDALQQKLAKLEARREALFRKAQKAEAKA